MSRKAALLLLFIMLVVCIGGVFFLVSLFTPSAPTPRAHSYLVLNLEGEIPDYPTARSLFQKEEPLSLWGISQALREAAGDSRIDGLLMSVSSPGMGMAKSDEFLGMLKEFRKAGKKVHVYLEVPTLKDYYLASEADTVTLMPSGELLFTGLSFETVFLKNLFQKIGVTADFVHTGDYKTAGNTFTESAYTPAHREIMDSLLDSFYSRFAEVIGQRRGLDRNAFDAMVDKGIILPEEALETKLVERLAFRDQLEEALAGEGKKLSKLPLSQYIPRPDQRKGSRNIAVVFLQGEIREGASGEDPLSGTIVGASTVADAIKEAAKDESVKALVLRVDSPGGSAIASDLILRALERAAAKKPLVISMGDYAASGGYWVSTSSSLIFADPLTLTGSIGVLAGKFSLKGLFEKVGISTDRVERGKYAHMFSSSEALSDEEKALLEKSVRGMYSRFLSKVAKARKMKVEDVDKIAQGRVWTGKDGVSNGLVDKIGGLQEALAEAMRLAKLSPSTAGVCEYPKPRSRLLADLSDLELLKAYGGVLSPRKAVQRLPYRNFQALLLVPSYPVLTP